MEKLEICGVPVTFVHVPVNGWLAAFGGACVVNRQQALAYKNADLSGVPEYQANAARWLASDEAGNFEYNHSGAGLFIDVRLAEECPQALRAVLAHEKGHLDLKHLETRAAMAAAGFTVAELMEQADTDEIQADQYACAVLGITIPEFLDSMIEVVSVSSRIEREEARKALVEETKKRQPKRAAFWGI